MPCSSVRAFAFYMLCYYTYRRIRLSRNVCLFARTQFQRHDHTLYSETPGADILLSIDRAADVCFLHSRKQENSRVYSDTSFRTARHTTSTYADKFQARVEAADSHDVQSPQLVWLLSDIACCNTFSGKHPASRMADHNTDRCNTSFCYTQASIHRRMNSTSDSLFGYKKCCHRQHRFSCIPLYPPVIGRASGRRTLL